MLSTTNPQVAVCLNLTRAIGRTRTVEEIYAITLDALELGLGVSRASILLFDSDGVMRFKAYRRLSEAYRRAVEGHSPWTPDSPEAEPIVVPDVADEPTLAAYLPTIEAEGIKAMAFIPLVSLGRVLGKFMLYFDAPRTLSDDELQLAGMIASQVAFAVERTHAEEQARRSEARLRFALEAADMGTWAWDLGTQIRWSDNLERIHGLPPGTFDGTFHSYAQEIHPEDRERVFASVRRALDEGVMHDVEYRIVAPDGTVRWVEAKGTVELGPDGTPALMSGVCMNVTPRKQAEIARVQALEESTRASQRLAAIVESSGDAIVSKNLDGEIVSWNRAAERLFGYTEAEVVGRSIMLIIPLERRAEEDLVLSRIRAGQQVEMETIRRRKDGTLVPISLMVSPIKDAHGRISGASKVARDISARKRDEAERAELHRRLTLLVTASASLLNAPETESVLAATIALAQQLLVADGYAVWVNDPDGIWRMVKSEGISPSFAGRLIRSPRGTLGPGRLAFSEPLAVLDALSHPMLEEQRAAYIEEGIASMLVCPMQLGIDRAGTLVFYYRGAREFRAVDVETGQTLANLVAAAITTADLYDQLRRQRNEAEAARRRAAFLADETAILSSSLDYEQTLAAVAQLAVPEMADWCTVDAIGDDGRLQRLATAHADPAKLECARTLQERYPPDPSAPYGVHEVIRTGDPAIMAAIPAELVETYARDDEHLRLLRELSLSSYMCVPLKSARGTLGAMTFVHAGSGRHYADSDLAFAEEVARRAALALENAFAYKTVNEASRLKDEFLATLSHELRTPLNAILGYSQMLNIGALEGERRTTALTILMRNAEALKQIIDDVLDVARITSGKLRLNVQSVDLAEILKDAAASIQPAADAKGVTLTTKIGSRVAPVSGDPDRLQQIVWNLLSNAVKFTPRGGRVQLRLEQLDSSVQIVVTDNGQGIDAAFLPHMFQRFRQADSRFAREHGGLGLGLSIVRELAELHGGTVTAASEGPGKGATFTVRLPPLAVRLVPEAPPGSRASAPVTLLRQMPDRLKGVRILAVDNEPDSLGLLRLTLESAGAEVTTAESGAAALDLIAGGFDAIIADIGMPKMDGLELIRTIRTTLPAPLNQVAAAALTAYTRAEDRLAALASGYQIHLAKPVNATELVIAVAALVGR